MIFMITLTHIKAHSNWKKDFLQLTLYKKPYQESNAENIKCGYHWSIFMWLKDLLDPVLFRASKGSTWVNIVIQELSWYDVFLSQLLIKPPPLFPLLICVISLQSLVYSFALSLASVTVQIETHWIPPCAVFSCCSLFSYAYLFKHLLDHLSCGGLFFYFS